MRPTPSDPDKGRTSAQPNNHAPGRRRHVAGLERREAHALSHLRSEEPAGEVAGTCAPALEAGAHVPAVSTVPGRLSPEPPPT